MCAEHAKRVTIMQPDMELATRIGKRVQPDHKKWFKVIYLIIISFQVLLMMLVKISKYSGHIINSILYVYVSSFQKWLIHSRMKISKWNTPVVFANPWRIFLGMVSKWIRNIYYSSSIAVLIRKV